MVLRVDTHIATERPELVFDGIADLARWPLFTGWGPLPGIASAVLEEGAAIGAGAVVRVENTDGSVHRERFERWERGRGLTIRFALGPPASWLLAGIVETMDRDERGLARRMELTPRAWWAWPAAWAVSWAMQRALAANNRMLEDATR